MPVLMFLNIKGGVAKTTSAVAVSQFLAERGNRVLVIDADHQCAASEILLGEYQLRRRDTRHRTLHDMFNKLVKNQFHAETAVYYVVRSKPESDIDGGGELSVLPCSLRMDDFQKNYHQARKTHDGTKPFLSVRDTQLRLFENWLRTNYDYTIIDCPPSLPLQVQMLMRLADAYIVPCIPDSLSIRGASYLQDRLRRKRSTIRGLGTLWTLYRAQNAMHVDKVRCGRRGSLFSGMPEPFSAIVPNTTAVTRALELSDESLNERYTHDIATTYRGLVDEIVERCHAEVLKV